MVRAYRRRSSPEAKSLIREGVGYRCENFMGSGVRDAKAIIFYEALELGNKDVVEDSAKVLGVAPHPHAIADAIKKRFGPDAMAIWLGTKECVEEEYCVDVGCDPKTEAPSSYRIPKDAVLLVDLGEEGQLFVMSGKTFLEVEWA